MTDDALIDYIATHPGTSIERLCGVLDIPWCNAPGQFRGYGYSPHAEKLRLQRLRKAGKIHSRSGRWHIGPSIHDA